MTQDDINNAEWANRANWSLLTYKSTQDTRLFVPKRIGFGWTLNFGHPRGKAVFAAFITLPIVIASVILLLTANKK